VAGSKEKVFHGAEVMKRNRLFSTQSYKQISYALTKQDRSIRLSRLPKKAGWQKVNFICGWSNRLAAYTTKKAPPISRRGFREAS
jgi:hypothetical protein